MIKIDHISFSYGEENENTGGVRDIDLNIEDWSVCCPLR